MGAANPGMDPIRRPAATVIHGMQDPSADITTASTPIKQSQAPPPAIMTPSFSEEIPAIDLALQHENALAFVSSQNASHSASQSASPTPGPGPSVNACACISIAPALAVLQDLYSALRRGLTGETADNAPARVANTSAAVDTPEDVPNHTKPENVHLVDEHFRHDDYTIM